MSVDSPLVRALRSATMLTGILCGAAAAVAYLAGGFAFDVIFGRLSPNEWAGTFIIGLPILGFGLAILGGLRACSFKSSYGDRVTQDPRIAARFLPS